VSKLVTARWYEVRPAQNRKPVTYECPFCSRRVPAVRPHVLIRPEGQGVGRRHAHTRCAARAHARGLLPSRAEWRATQSRRRGLLARLWALLRGAR
jgi:hypothetical protein